MTEIIQKKKSSISLKNGHEQLGMVIISFRMVSGLEK